MDIGRLARAANEEYRSRLEMLLSSIDDEQVKRYLTQMLQCLESVEQNIRYLENYFERGEVVEE